MASIKLLTSYGPDPKLDVSRATLSFHSSPQSYEVGTYYGQPHLTQGRPMRILTYVPPFACRESRLFLSGSSM